MNKQPVKVLYHANCDDGFGSAYAAWCFFNNETRAYKYEVEYIPVSYGGKSVTVSDKDIVYIVDFSYSREAIQSMKLVAKDLVILDHHKTAEAELKGLPYAIFDMNRSGAMITWEYFHKEKAPLLIQYIQDNDLWLHKLPHSKEITRLIRSEKQDFYQWQDFQLALETQFNRVVDNAEAIERYFQNQVLFNAQHAKFLTDTHGRKTCIINCNATFTSEILQHLIKENQLNYGVSWFRNNKDETVLSFRGNGETDVSEIAKSLGGGGHKSAAGAIGLLTLLNYQSLYLE